MNSAYHCPFCGQHSVFTEKIVESRKVEFKLGASPKKFVNATIIHRVCANNDCNQSSLKIIAEKEIPSHFVGVTGLERLELFLPDKSTTILELPTCVPEPIRKDYREAYSILSLSPKSAATLARRCLQGMIRDFWPSTTHSKLINEIRELEDKVHPDTWKAIDAVREIGNIAAHMEKDVNIIINIDEDEAELLLQLIENLADDWYVQREAREKRKQKIIAIAQKKAVPPPHPPQPEHPFTLPFMPPVTVSAPLIVTLPFTVWGPSRV